MAPPTHRRDRWRLAWPLIVLLAWGLLGLGVLVVRRFRPPDHSCVRCRRRRTACRAATWTVAVLTVAGSVAWVHSDVVDPPARCLVPAADADHDRALDYRGTHSGWRTAVRTALTAPATGIAHVYASPRAQRRCDAGPLTVTLLPGVSALPSAASKGGVTVGSVFLTGLDPAETPEYLAHEDVHVDQWAYATLSGGLLAQPVLYSVDDAFFPDERNHFERAAGLAGGDYAQPPSLGPDPQWTHVAVIAAIALTVLWPSARRASRAVGMGAAGLRFAEARRCPRHSRGWIRGRDSTAQP